MNNKSPYFSTRKPRHCPACESHRTARILYGMPAPEVLPKVESGEIVLGGCCIINFEPSWECLDCHTQIYSERLRSKYQEYPEFFNPSS